MLAQYKVINNANLSKTIGKAKHFGQPCGEESQPNQAIKLNSMLHLENLRTNTIFNRCRMNHE